MTATDYRDFIASKERKAEPAGFDSDGCHESLFDHQTAIVRWAVRMGRAAIFADTGLGKTRMQLDWARQVVAHTGMPVLLLAPLAVGDQTIAEAAEMGISAGGLGSGCDVEITNYERLHHVDVPVFGGVVLDESSILKSYNGSVRTALIEAFRDIPYRLACTATPAPNDHTELGNHAEFLGVCTRAEMLAEYFLHDSGSRAASGWRLKGHAVGDFWRWVSQWAVMLRLPSDLGFDDGAYLLPPLTVSPVIVDWDPSATKQDGMLFAVPASTLTEQRNVRRESLEARCAKAADIASGEGQCIVWCELNDESAMVASMVSDAVEVTGSDSPEDKAAALLAFARGEIRVLVTKPKIAGFGMNWQSCSRMVFVGVSHSYESFYQAVRRCWRFGQRNPVSVYLVQTAQDGRIAASLQRKADNADHMAREMVALVKDHQMESVLGARPGTIEDATQAVIVPHWMG